MWVMTCLMSYVWFQWGFGLGLSWICVLRSALARGFPPPLRAIP